MHINEKEKGHSQAFDLKDHTHKQKNNQYCMPEMVSKGK
jgi:hypothetical protein